MSKRSKLVIVTFYLLSNDQPRYLPKKSQLEKSMLDCFIAILIYYIIYLILKYFNR